MLFVRGKTASEHRYNALKSDMANNVLAEPQETGMKCLYAARSVTKFIEFPR
jgi:hypothetical protein